jgi:hypothetical protein
VFAALHTNARLTRLFHIVTGTRISEFQSIHINYGIKPIRYKRFRLYLVTELECAVVSLIWWDAATSREREARVQQRRVSPPRSSRSPLADSFPPHHRDPFQFLLSLADVPRSGGRRGWPCRRSRESPNPTTVLTMINYYKFSHPRNWFYAIISFKSMLKV